MPAPADVDTVDNGQAGRAEQGDEVVFTFAGAVDPTLVLAGWDGSATAVTVRIAGASSDVLTVWNAGGTTQLTELGGGCEARISRYKRRTTSPLHRDLHDAVAHSCPRERRIPAGHERNELRGHS